MGISPGKLLLGAAAAMAAGACCGTASADDAPSATVELRLRHALPRTSQAVAFDIRICNPTPRRVELTLPNAQVFDVVVSREGREVWRWSAGRVFAAVLTPLALPARSCRNHRARWEPVDGLLRGMDGQAVQPGRHEAIAVLKTRPEVRSGPAPLDLRDAAAR